MPHDFNLLAGQNSGTPAQLVPTVVLPKYQSVTPPMHLHYDCREQCGDFTVALTDVSEIQPVSKQVTR